MSSSTDGMVVAAHGRISVGEIARTWYRRPQDLPADVDPGGLEVTAGYKAKRDTGTFSYAAHATAVLVDPETGALDILDYVVVEDGGVLLNPMIVDGQIVGGVAQGIGTALYEEMRFDGNGQPTSTTFADYLLPGSTDVPSVRIFHMETPSPYTRFGQKGVGEPVAGILGMVTFADEPLRVDPGVYVPRLPDRGAGPVRRAAILRAGGRGPRSLHRHGRRRGRTCSGSVRPRASSVSTSMPTPPVRARATACAARVSDLAASVAGDGRPGISSRPSRRMSRPIELRFLPADVLRYELRAAPTAVADGLDLVRRSRRRRARLRRARAPARCPSSAEAQDARWLRCSTPGFATVVPVGATTSATSGDRGARRRGTRCAPAT